MSGLMRSILALVLCLTLGAGQALAITGDDDFGSTKNPDFVQAARLVEAGDYAGAIPLLRKSVDVDPNNADAYNLLGFSHRKLGDVEMALAHYRRALEMEPGHRGANEYLGELKAKIEAFITYFNNTMAKPFKWTYQGKPLTA